MTISNSTGDHQYVSDIEPELIDLANMAAIATEIVFDVLGGDQTSVTGHKEYKYVGDQHLKMILFAVRDCQHRASKLLAQYYEHVTPSKA